MVDLQCIYLCVIENVFNIHFKSMPVHTIGMRLEMEARSLLLNPFYCSGRICKMIKVTLYQCEVQATTLGCSVK